jgi:proteasome-associated ATPase
VRAIRDSIELPLLHADLFRRFKHTVPKGFLLYGPPGCGKTLLGRATAHNLRVQLREETGIDRPEFFLSVKGPEILNMWLGESERQVRDLFAQCREKAAEGRLAFLFIDEAESVLGTRQAFRGGTNILSTLVPMFCTEMDGLEPLQNVVVILASNRADLIDPAILRPGRIDRKIRVRRPDEAAGREIYRIYLSADLPLAEPAEDLVNAITAEHYAKKDDNRFLEVSYRSGRRDHLYRGDLASGAIIAAIVERAKEYAIRRSIETGRETPINRADLTAALAQEYRENDLFPPNDVTEDWLKLTDFDPENVVRLTPYRPAKERVAANPAI